MITRAERLLAFYEAGRGALPVERARLLAGAETHDVPLGDIDRQVWAVRQSLFPGQIAATAQCSACAAQMELTLPDGFGPPARVGNAVLTVPFGATDWRVRLPQLGDISPDGVVMDNLSPGAPWQDPAFVAAVEAAFEAADPGQHLQLALQCHACGVTQSLTFDVVAFLWAQIEVAAQRLVSDVARLARAFGWREADILAMSGARRALYLEGLGQ